MPDFSAERSLLVFILLNTSVFGAAFLFVRRMMKVAGAQAVIDAALVGYAVQYAAVGIPGLLGFLHPAPVEAMGFGLSGVLLVSAFTPRVAWASPTGGQSPPCTCNKRRFVFAVALFAVSFVSLFVHTQAYLPVISNDAMTYHFPAAVQWLQRGRIGLFQTWFFNPSNTYSPLAGSMFIAWLIVPFYGDLLARFVEVPMLLCIGVALYRLMTLTIELGRTSPDSDRGDTPRLSGSLIAAAAILARPIFLPCMMGKDDLFVAFFFLAALIALSRAASHDRFAPLRLGIAVGLLLATKYTALLCAPMLLLAVDGPRWRQRQWITAIASAALIAGPWYLRNWILTGNPLFPLAINHLFPGLFTSARSVRFDSLRAAFSVVTNGTYGLPIALAAVLALGWILCGLTAWRDVLRSPMTRACVIGPAIGFAVFFLASPFPEVRFLLPVFLLLFACVGQGVGSLGRWGGNQMVKCDDVPSDPRPSGPGCQRTSESPLAIANSALLLGVSILTLFDRPAWATTAFFAGVSAAIAVGGCVLHWWAGHRRMRWAGVVGGCAIVAAVFVYINWSAYSREPIDPSAYDQAHYGELNQLWQFVDQHVPADATVAYTNMYLVYPLQGRALRRQLVYLPTRAGVSTLADLGWLGSRVPGEQLVPAAIAATKTTPNQSIWLGKLHKSGAEYLVIGRNGEAPEETFAAGDRDFYLMFSGPGGWVYRVLHAAAPRDVSPDGAR